MPKLVICGSMALDTIETPYGKRQNIIGGSASYAALAAAKFCPVGIISSVGNDFDLKRFSSVGKRLDLTGVTILGRTLRWSGRYDYAMQEAKTRSTKLNSMAHFRPTLPAAYQSAGFYLLANADPRAQLELLRQVKPKGQFIAADTMNFWIFRERAKLLKVIKRIHLLCLNENEARQLLETPNLVQAGQRVLALGPAFVIIKKGEHGALLFSRTGIFAAAGYPLESVIDPTGAGDALAGALMGYLASQIRLSSTLTVSEPLVRKALVIGCTLASFTAEAFGVENLVAVGKEEIRNRYEVYQKIHAF